MPKDAIVNGDLYYLVDACGDEAVSEVIASNFADSCYRTQFLVALEPVIVSAQSIMSR